MEFLKEWYYYMSIYNRSRTSIRQLTISKEIIVSVTDSQSGW